MHFYVLLCSHWMNFYSLVKPDNFHPWLVCLACSAIHNNNTFFFFFLIAILSRMREINFAMVSYVLTLDCK